MEVRIVNSIDNIDAKTWDSFVSDCDPFGNHAFLHALESSKSVDESTGWIPCHIEVSDKGNVVGVAPMYLKMHSYGEYIFDWGWAQGAERAGLQYYPKLLNAIPFTPATGTRLFSHTQEGKKILWQAMNQLCTQMGASSAHILFLPEEEYYVAQNVPNTIPRLTYQFHWNNPGVQSFDQWLSLFRAKARKKVLVERKKAQEGVDRIYHLRGSSLKEHHIEKIWEFYCNTIDRKWGSPYLTRSFFNCLTTTLADQTLVFLAEKNEEIIASSLCFQRGENLYGRYWGCSEFAKFLHFELCYHQPIELCIKNGWKRFEAGAQGQHKLKRGLLPSFTYSVHQLVHPGLHRAVEQAMIQENKLVEREVQIQAEHSPLKKITGN